MTKKRVLIVDDQRDIRMLLRAGLEVFSPLVEVIDVPSGEEAMLVISRQKYDLLVSDVRLAGMSGLELIRKVRRRNPGLRVILITGMTDSEVRQQVKESGADSFFFKPVDMADFLVEVQRYLDIEAPKPADAAELPPRAKTPAFDVFAMLAELRQTLDAVFVLLMDSSGKVLASSGNVPAVPPGGTAGGTSSGALLRSAAAAAVEFSRPSSEGLAAGYLFFRSAEYHLHLAPFSRALYLLAVCRARPTSEQGRIMVSLLQAVDVLLKAQVEVWFGAVPKPTASSDIHQDGEAVSGMGDDTGLAQLDDVLKKAGDQKADTGELDGFWNALTGETQQDNQSASGSITYEQARQLGLAPRDGDG